MEKWIIPTKVRPGDVQTVSVMIYDPEGVAELKKRYSNKERKKNKILICEKKTIDDAHVRYT